MSDSVDNPLLTELEECKAILRNLSTALQEDNAELCRARAHWAGARTYMPSNNQHAQHVDKHLGHSIDYRIDIDDLLQRLTMHLDIIQQETLRQAEALVSLQRQLANQDGSEDCDLQDFASKAAKQNERT